MGTKVTGASKSGGNIKVSVENVKDPSKKEEVCWEIMNFQLLSHLNLDWDVLLVCVVRRKYTANLGLSWTGIERDEKGRIPVNSRFQTVVPK